MAGKDPSQLGSSGLLMGGLGAETPDLPGSPGMNYDLPGSPGMNYGFSPGSGYGAGRYLGLTGLPPGRPTQTVPPPPPGPTPYGSVYHKVIADAKAKKEAEDARVTQAVAHALLGSSLAAQTSPEAQLAYEEWSKTIG